MLLRLFESVQPCCSSYDLKDHVGPHHHRRVIDTHLQGYHTPHNPHSRKIVWEVVCCHVDVCSDPKDLQLFSRHYVRRLPAPMQAHHYTLNCHPSHLAVYPLGDGGGVGGGVSWKELGPEIDATRLR